MVILRWLLTETGRGEVAPKIVYYTLRGVMFLGSFVLEDWAIHELVQSPRQRRVAVILVASSSAIVPSVILGFLLVFGLFNRITFPAFILVPSLYLLPHFVRKPFTLLFLLLSALLTTLLALTTDSAFYTPTAPLSTIFTYPPPPLRALLYNLSPSNLSTHGLHPHYTHFLINLPLLLGPTLPLLLTPPYSPHLLVPLLGTAILSLIPHQEPRFLLPAIPLLLSSVRLPFTRSKIRLFVGAWVFFNLALGTIFGIFHQGGVMPMQIWLGADAHISQTNGTDVLWWRTYSPPVWLLDGKAAPQAPGASATADSLRTIDLMGIPFPALLSTISTHLPPCPAPPKRGAPAATNDTALIVVAPLSSLELDSYTSSATSASPIAANAKPGSRPDTREEYTWQHIHTERRHFNLDDLDFAEDGVFGTVGRVVGRRGLGAWRVGRRCGR
ncbi:alpha 1,2 mannosyltransferase [Trapelia coarctata]|nr:alpha 1,2 mannosyltransferase [Trapelia coarctata]